jgi:hypothetical protein
MSKIVENDRNLLKDALVEYNAIKEEAIRVAKDRLAKTMPDVIENFLKEEMEKAMMDEAGIISTDETMIDDQESSVMETMKDVDSPLGEGDEHDHEDHMEKDMENEEEMSDLDDVLTAEAIEEALKELDEMKMDEEELDEHNISFEVEFDEDSLNISNVKSDEKDFDDVEFELDLEDDDMEMSDEEEMEDDSEIELEVSDDEVEMEDESEEDLEEEMDLEDIDLDSLEDEEEVEESLSHVITHQNAKQAGSHNHVNYQKEKNLRPGVKAESKLKVDLNKVLKENEELRQINLEFKDALNKYKTQLYEMAVFNANLSHVNNLFVEHTTSTDEKKEILSKYKSVSTIEESKKLYSEFANKLNESKSSKKTIEEMVNDSRNGDSGSQKLNESISQPSANDGIKAIKYMMNYIENKRK